MNHISLFSGIGGIDLAAHWAGFQTVAFVEQDKYCQKVLAKHWPGVPIYDDIRTITAKSMGIEPGTITLISGGFPCQDVSNAGTGEGLGGARSGLWYEMLRIICEVKPEYVLVENVAALVRRGMPEVLRGLAASGYDAEWSCLQAIEAGAPHERNRLFIVAYPNQKHGEKWMGHIFNRTEKVLRTGSKERSKLWVQTPDFANRMDDGVSAGLYKNRVGALGNAVVPQQVYPILKAIADYEKQTTPDPGV